MIKEIKIPSPGESITEVEIAEWHVKNGDVVGKDQEVGTIESDKASLPLIAQNAGKITLLAEEGDVVEVGAIAATIEEGDFGSPEIAEPPMSVEAVEQQPEEKIVVQEKTATQEKEVKDIPSEVTDSNVKVTPKADAMMKNHNLSVDDVLDGMRRIKSSDVEAVMSSATVPPTFNTSVEGDITAPERGEQSKKMSGLRRKIAERLVSVKNETAMLTTFNEVDMTQLINLKAELKDKFIEQYGVKLGFMSFFTKAVAEALKQFPSVNSMIQGDQIVEPNYVDVSIAVSSPKGLVVPVVRDVHTMSIPSIEKAIAAMAQKAREGKLSIEEMTGGTFTITNGGVFGSLMSTPILNPPQSAILGMHNIVQRPMAKGNQVVILPMMYIALSYDHRVIDGRESVSFLKLVKSYVENPGRLLLGV